MREGVFAAPPSAGTSTSGAAATAQPASNKKEKHQRSKQADKEKDKDKEEKQASSGKRKKEKISVEKIDTGDFVVGIGDKLKVNYHEKKSPSSHGSTYEAKVIEINVQRGVPMYLVHYTGWNNRYDEWVPRERIAENLTKGSKQKTRTISTSSANSGSAPKLKKRGSPLKEPALCMEKSKTYKLDKDQVQLPVEQKTQQLTQPTLGPVESYGAGTPEAMSNLSTPTTSSGHAQLSASSTYSQLTPHHATPFDALRKSPSFNLNITALNEELAQTVQETTRALTDALQPPSTPVPPPVSASESTPTAVTPVITATPTAGSAGLSCPSTPPTGANPVLASPKLSTPPQAINASKQPPAPHIVGSPFIETRNVFELSTSNEGSGYSSGESKDNKFEKLENVKILLAGAVGPFDLDAGSYEQKTSSIADKVLKAISQKKEEVENNKGKPPVEPAAAAKTPGSEDVVPSPTAKLDLCSSAIKLDTLKLLSEPLKIQTGPLLGELYRPGPATSSPETKSILESSLPAKNSELSETIQKLECAIQQRKTPVGGALSLASSTAGTPPNAHTPNSTATAGAGFSDESMDSTDSEQRLVIEDVIAEEHTTTTTTGEQKSPGSQQEEGQTNTATMVTALPPAVNSTLAIVGITPLPPDTPPPVPVAAIQQQQQHQVQSGQQQQAAKTGEVNPSAPNSSPDSASQDESGEETKKNAELEHEDSTGLGALNKRKRNRKPLPINAQTSAAVAAQLQSLGKRRRQVSGMRNQKTTTTAAGSDTDDNSDNIAPNTGQQQQRQSARQHMMPQSNAQQQQQQQLLQQQQTQLQQGIQSTNSSGVRPCPYNFLVELDPALSSDECITILRKQIQDLRKAYNTIKGELAVIDRRRKKLRRREREKKQQQLQSQQQGKICA
ncbi:GM22924 [Drosophila sechellia]|uniref:GM22924 n=1 Tax=Drosophila sechellia TaxID=7238 RepID=B4I6Y2_DROSE|nr:GM22924 [Drosophila sechellia]